MLTSLIPEIVPRTDLPTWLIREMREQSIVDEAVGGGSGDAVLDASTTLVEPSKPAREYIPLLVDDDVRQKGRHNKRTMIANRAEKNIEEAVKAAAEAPVCASSPVPSPFLLL